MLPILPALVEPGLNPPRGVRATPRGHLAYAEAPQQALVALDSGIQVRKNVLEQLIRLLQAAERDGVPLKVAAGFRSIEMQRAAFESGAKKKGISLRSYAWWTAPPGFSEHHTGLAVDFADPKRPKTNFTPSSFSKTEAYAWLKSHAKGFGFELSFGQNSGLRVAFEPWHWRFVGDDESRAIFAMARPGRVAQDGVPPAQ
ncbi:MAG: M15 family metallopeptidase [Holophagaceae bacterium]|nr:M15 family metallopeptidase [Holophagaceae bacterium]